MTVNIKNYPDKNKRDVGEPWPFVKVQRVPFKEVPIVPFKEVPRVPFTKVPRVPVNKDD